MPPLTRPGALAKAPRPTLRRFSPTNNLRSASHGARARAPGIVAVTFAIALMSAHTDFARGLANRPRPATPPHFPQSSPAPASPARASRPASPPWEARRAPLAWSAWSLPTCRTRRLPAGPASPNNPTAALLPLAPAAGPCVVRKVAAPIPPAPDPTPGRAPECSTAAAATYP